ncbi:MAG: alpha-mannosidase [Eubacteriales bacterium]
MLFLKERVGKLIEELESLIYRDSLVVEDYKYIKTTEKLRNVYHMDSDNWETWDKAQLWGGHREYYQFETEIIIPEKFQGECVVYELKTGREGQWDATNPQFTIFVNGTRRQGLDINHRELVLTKDAKAGEKYHIVLSAFTGDQNFALQLDSSIKVLDHKTEKYFYDISVPFQVASLLPDTEHAYIMIIQALNESLNRLDLRKVYSILYYESLEKAQSYITNEFYEKLCGDSIETVYCVGHTHIDVAWLWSLLVTEDKAVRSFSTVLELMSQYPEYQFMSSQPQLYKYVQKNAPDVYEKIKEKIKENRWQAEGGMFLEADCNLSSGESLVRQFLYGINFFKKEFGVENEILWLPDVFGYSAALPQIMKKCKIQYFMTTKISWNEMNKLPYDTFMWEGIDGTKILTHFSPARDYQKPTVGATKTEHFTTYNAFINPSQVKGAWERYSQKELNQEVMISYGYGDGGGGPTKEMLENQKRLAYGIPGCPKTKMSNPREFFHILEDKVKGSKYLPDWSGELYLEYHRGTYTSMSRNKKYNRQSEFMAQNLETYGTMAQIWLHKGYPKEELAEIWEVILRNQFHDILPGSSIKEVYDDSKIEYERIKKQGITLINEQVQTLVASIDTNRGAIVVCNPNGLQLDGIVEVSLESIDTIEESIYITDGIVVTTMQKLENGHYIFTAMGVPSKGYKTYHITQEPIASTGNMRVSERVLENNCIKVVLDEFGHMVSIYDKKVQREVLPENQCGNILMTYEDKPHNYDAWDLNNYYTEKSWEITDVDILEVVESGPVRGTVKIGRKYLDSYIEQYISIMENSSEILIRNEIDWKEKQIFMKTLFPVDVHTDEATFDIQYGNVKRKTHYNTSWDQARFEVCMHKWVDISEDDYGVSLINDCKYGCSVHNGVIGLSMLKSGIYPNPEADKEHHSFQFSIFPHEGDWKKAGTVSKAYAMNNPFKASRKENEIGTLPSKASFISSNCKNVVIEVVKQAEESDDVVVRMYEYYNRRTIVRLSFGMEIKEIVVCNMLEEVLAPLEIVENQVIMTVKPYEIITLKIKMK